MWKAPYAKLSAGCAKFESSGPFCAVSETGAMEQADGLRGPYKRAVVLVGALAGSYLGFKGTMNLSEGETSDKVMLAGGESVLELPFMVRCDKFEVSFYDTGAPKEFRSDLAIIDKGREVLKDSIIVNDPLTYEGITFYQAYYGTTLKGAEIELTDRDSGAKIAMSLPMLQPVNIPGTSDQLTITDYQARFDGVRAGYRTHLSKRRAAIFVPMDSGRPAFSRQQNRKLPGPGCSNRHS